MKVSAADLIDVGRDILQRGKSFRFEARGRSMVPFIRDGDVLEVEPIDARAIRFADVIFYHVDEAHAVAHRVIKRGLQDHQPVFVARGDAQVGAGERFSSDQVLGRVSAVERNGKRRVLKGPLHKSAYALYRMVFPFFVNGRRLAAYFVSGIQGIRGYRLLNRRLTRPDIRYRWQPDEDSVSSLVGEGQGRVIATLSLHHGAGPDPSSTDPAGAFDEGWWISSMWVHWRYRGLGIGRRLTESACQYAASQGATEVKLHVFNDNKPALRLYQRAGFTARSQVATADEHRVVPGRHRQRLLMGKELRPFIANRPVSCEQLLVSLSRSTQVFEDLPLPPACGWPEFFEAARRQRLAPLVSKVLEAAADKVSLPEPTRALFRNSYLVTASRYAALSVHFQEVFRALEQEGIDFIVFKGPVLAETVYRDPGVRPMTDVDILVRHHDLMRAHRLLRGLGYKVGLSDESVAALRPNPYHNSLLYSDPEGGKGLVHLYWHLVNLYLGPRAVFEEIPMEGFWQRAERVETAGHRVRTLDPADTFAYLCLHAFLHGFTPLILLFDLDAVRRGKDSSFWQDVVERAEELGWQRYVYHALTVLRDWGLPVEDIPSFVWDRLKPERISCFERAFIAAALRRRPAGLFGRLSWALLGVQPGILARARFLLHNVFIPKIDMAVVRQKDPSRLTWRDTARRLLSH